MIAERWLPKAAASTSRVPDEFALLQKGAQAGLPVAQLALAQFARTHGICIWWRSSGSFQSDFFVQICVVDQATGNIISVNGFDEPQGGGLAAGLAVDPV